MQFAPHFLLLFTAVYFCLASVKGRHNLLVNTRDLFDNILTLQQKTKTCCSTGKINLEEILEGLEDGLSVKAEMAMINERLIIK
jgi:hypothetical protein